MGPLHGPLGPLAQHLDMGPLHGPLGPLAILKKYNIFKETSMTFYMNQNDILYKHSLFEKLPVLKKKKRLFLNKKCVPFVKNFTF